jgi:exodeoxyribonuclease-3
VKVASWNVNSIRVRLNHVKGWLQSAQPDVIALQEIKVPNTDFPTADLASVGFHCAVDGQKGYNGVALLSRTAPSDIVCGLPTMKDEQKRVLAASYNGLRLVNLYVPNGQTVDSDKYYYKLKWLDALREWLSLELQHYPRLAVLGDFNIAPEDRDVHDPEAWRGQVLCSEPERDKLRALFDLGFVDVFRRFDQPERAYSWWDYRAGAFRRNRGLRIDLILASPELVNGCTGCGIDVEPRRREQASDHAPVWATLQ